MGKDSRFLIQRWFFLGPVFGSVFLSFIQLVGQEFGQLRQEASLKAKKNLSTKIFTIGGAYFAGELDANRAIDQGTRLALKVESASSGDVFERPKSFAGQMLGKMMSSR